MSSKYIRQLIIPYEILLLQLLLYTDTLKISTSSLLLEAKRFVLCSFRPLLQLSAVFDNI